MFKKIALRYLEKVVREMQKRKDYFGNSLMKYPTNNLSCDMGRLRANQEHYDTMISDLKEIISWIDFNM